MLKTLSFVIPCYRSENTIRKVVNEIITTVGLRSGYDYEIICVNDFSPDHVIDVLSDLARSDRKIKVINMAINKGKHSAMLAGMRFATGKMIVNLDDDFQCPVYELWKLIEPIEKDECDIATAAYSEKKERGWKIAGSNLNNMISSILLERPKELRIENFNVMKRFVVDEILRYNGPFPYIEGLIFRSTHRIVRVPMEERNRADNNSTGFTLKKSVSLFANGLTAFSVKPLRISMIVGFAAAIAGLLMAVVVLIQRIVGKIGIAGYTTTVILILVIGGLNLMSLGLIGEYLGRVYISLNRSPQYVIKNTINCENREN